ncbi:MAG: WD40/YVTN/BNR-like repeat-containing protein [Acidimicrobiales bacterium]
MNSIDVAIEAGRIGALDQGQRQLPGSMLDWSMHSSNACLTEELLAVPYGCINGIGMPRGSGSSGAAGRSYLTGVVVIVILAALLVGCSNSVKRAAKPKTPRATTSASGSGQGSLLTDACSSKPKSGYTKVPLGSEVQSSICWLSDITFVTPSLGFGLTKYYRTGGSTELVRTVDGGKTWRVINADVPGAPDKLDFTSPTSGYAWGAEVAVTTDGGLHWTVTLDHHRGIAALVPIGSNVWVILEHSKHFQPVEVLSSNDGGVTWQAAPSQPGVSANKWYFLGYGYGAVLSRVNLTTSYILAGSLSPGSSGVARPVVAIAKTINSGKTWAQVSDPCSTTNEGNYIFGGSLVAVTSKDIWLVCPGEPAVDNQMKTVWRSNDGGAKWYEVAKASASGSSLPSGTSLPASAALSTLGSLPFGGYVMQIAVVSPSLAWLALMNGALVTTTNGGRTWDMVNGMPHRVSQLTEVTFINATHGWALGEKLWATTNGVTWRLLTPRNGLAG